MKKRHHEFGIIVSVKECKRLHAVCERDVAIVICNICIFFTSRHRSSQNIGSLVRPTGKEAESISQFQCRTERLRLERYWHLQESNEAMMEFIHFQG